MVDISRIMGKNVIYGDKMKKLMAFSNEALKRARKARRLSLRRAVELFGRAGLTLDHSTLFQYENSKKNNAPNANDMPVICMVYKKPMDYFYRDPDKQGKRLESK